MKRTAIALLVLFTGCGSFDRMVAQATGYATSCVDGVVYMQFASGVTVKYNQDGTIQRCEKK